MRRRSHWGWGYEDERPSADELRAAAAGLAAHLGFGSPEPEQPVPLEAAELPAPRVALPPGLPLSQDAHARALHAHGRSYLDVVRGFRGRFPHAPDAVATPRDEDELRAVLEWAAAADLAVIPAGGGTSVTGGIDALAGPHAGAVTLSLRALDRVLEVDATSRAARIQAGATGPELERQLGEHGLTLRFFPQSFELSTLGGWIATRAAGHFATGPTHVDDLVESIRAITATGDVWESRRLPASGAGPSPDRLLLGSEGTLALITEAWVRVLSRPSERRGASVAFPTFAAGAAAVRAIVQDGLRPANCRLIDAREAALTFAGDGSSALLVLGFESSGAPVGEQLARACALCEANGGSVTEGRGGAGRSWREAFLRAPYVRDTLVAMGVLSETFESAVTWDRLDAFVDGRHRSHARGARAGGARDGPAHARLPRRRRAVLHRGGAGGARRGGGALARGQARRVGGGARRRRHDHAPPLGRPRPPSVLRAPAPGPVRRRAARGQGGAGPGLAPQPGGTLRSGMSVDASAKNMQAVCRAKEQHDKSCPWGGTGTEVHMNWFDIERIGWEEGDVICGLIVVGDESVATGMMRVTCDAEGDGGGRTEEEEVETVEAVAAERELETIGPSSN